jgi:hypothetical protein
MHSDEFKAAQSARFKVVPRSAEARERIAEGMAARPEADRFAWAAKIHEANARRTPEERARISEAIAASKRGKKRPPEVVAKLTGLKRSDETRAKLSAARRARPPMSAETRAKIAAGVTRARAAARGAE